MNRISPPRIVSLNPLLCVVAAIFIGAIGTGCAGFGRPKAEFNVQHRTEAPLHSYKVFFLPHDSRDRTGMTDKQLSDMAGLDNLRSAIVNELKERGYQVTSNLQATDISAYITYGYSSQGERGTNYHYQPTQHFRGRNGHWGTIPGYSTASSYAHDDQTIWVAIYDWAELKAANFEVERVRHVWRGQMLQRFQGVNGVTLDEAQSMAMNLLADFPTPRPSGTREAYPIAEREKLFPPNPAAEPANASPAGVTAQR